MNSKGAGTAVRGVSVGRPGQQFVHKLAPLAADLHGPLLLFSEKQLGHSDPPRIGLECAALESKLTLSESHV